MARASLTAQLGAYLQDRPNQWIDGRELAKVGGVYAYRTRISDCRTRYGMTIQNRLRTVTTGVAALGGTRTFTISEYRLVLATEPAKPLRGHDLNEWKLTP